MSFQSEIKAMMYSAGDTKNPDINAAEYIERFIKSQITKFLDRAIKLKNLKRNKNINLEDICFLLRKNRYRMKRVLNSKVYKDIRKNIVEEEDIIDINTEELYFSWMIEAKMIKIDTNPLFLQRVEEKGHFVNIALKNQTDKSTSFFIEESNIDFEQKERLRRTDLLTSKMSHREYLEFSECRQASFTFRKQKKFKEFLNTTERLKDDVVEILGFLCYEMVVLIVEKSIEAKNKKKYDSIIESGLFETKSQYSLSKNDIEETCIYILATKKNMLF